MRTQKRPGTAASVYLKHWQVAALSVAVVSEDDVLAFGVGSKHLMMRHFACKQHIHVVS